LDYVWIFIAWIPLVVAWWQGWTIVFWVAAAFLALTIIVAALSFSERNETKWKSSLTLPDGPFDLGGVVSATAEIEAFRSPPPDQSVEVRVRIVCEEDWRYQPSDSDRPIEGDRATAVEIDEVYRGDLRSGTATVPIELRLPMDRGAPTQRIKVAGNSVFNVTWSIVVTIEPRGFTMMDEEITVAPFLQSEASV